MARRQALDYYGFHEMRDEVNASLGYDQRECGEHFHPAAVSFAKWHAGKALPDIDHAGNATSSSQIWYAEYQAEIKAGTIQGVPYYDFWHFQLERCFILNVYNPCLNYVYVGLAFEKMESLADVEPWQLAVQQTWYQLFNHIADRDGFVTVMIDW